MPECKKCKEPIFFIKTEKGADMPVDMKFTSVYHLTDNSKWTLIRGNQPHWATCPNAKDFKK